MRVSEIFKGKLYRVYNNRKIKDVVVKNNKIQEPVNSYDILEDTEREFLILTFKLEK